MWRKKDLGLSDPKFWPTTERRRPILAPQRIQGPRKDVGKWWMRSSLSFPLVNIQVLLLR
ncbi:hypothetical protein Hanom_Chr16g01470181 [Helianthus anomalus]